eukprot:705109-Rhodomonas_salina.1
MSHTLSCLPCAHVVPRPCVLCVPCGSAQRERERKMLTCATLRHPCEEGAPTRKGARCNALIIWKERLPARWSVATWTHLRVTANPEPEARFDRRTSRRRRTASADMLGQHRGSGCEL